jgi:biopolymer transport protein ExbD
LQINLPTAEANSPQDKPMIITVEVDAGGRYMVNGNAVDGAEVNAIASALTKAAGDSKEEPTIVINADAKATHQSVVNVMEASRQANYTHITFATQIGTE